jgi:hypothetical protein
MCFWAPLPLSFATGSALSSKAATMTAILAGDFPAITAKGQITKQPAQSKPAPDNYRLSQG